MKTETITWYLPNEKLPDDCVDVLLDMANDSFLIGYRSEDGWWQINANAPIPPDQILAWAETPWGWEGAKSPASDQIPLRGKANAPESEQRLQEKYGATKDAETFTHYLRMVNDRTNS